MTIEEITDKFSLYKLCCGRSWHIQACDAREGNGLTNGLDWLSRQLVASGVHDLGQFEKNKLQIYALKTELSQIRIVTQMLKTQ